MTQGQIESIKSNLTQIFLKIGNKLNTNNQNNSIFTQDSLNLTPASNPIEQMQQAQAFSQLLLSDVQSEKTSVANSNNGKNGKIDDTKQGQIGDCWLLSSINALNSNSEGKKIIKNILDYDENGTMVHLATGDYYITNEEVQKAINSGQYSKGDEDMIILELATIKTRNDKNSHNFELPDEIKESSGSDNRGTEVDVLWGGHHEEALYYLTGKISEKIDDKALYDATLDEFQKNNGENICLGASIGCDTKTKDVNGKEVSLPGPHAYSIKSCDDNTVTIINPHDSSKEITLDRKTFKEKFRDITKCDLSNKNPKVGVKKPDEIYHDKDGSTVKIYKEAGRISEYTIDKNGNNTRNLINILNSDGSIKSKYDFEYEYNSSGKMTNHTYSMYNAKGELSFRDYEEYTYDSQGRKSKIVQKNYDSNNSLTGSHTETITYGDYGYKSSSKFTFFDKNNKKISTKENKFDGFGEDKLYEKFYKYDENGKIESGYMYEKTNEYFLREEYKEDGKLKYAEKCEYDENGKLIKIHYDKDGDGKFEETKDC